MTFFELILMAIGLSMDAFAVSLCKGLKVHQNRKKNAILAGLWFGGFQALMPLAGYFLGARFADIVSSVDHWIAFGLLMLIGINMIRESVSGKEESHSESFTAAVMFPLAVATSIDAFVVGVTYAFLSVNIFYAISIIGCVTFLFSFAGVLLGAKAGKGLGEKAGVIGGIVLIVMSIRILIEHLFF